ncbi:hypothetical protein VTI74DRAFT_7381 [Chaetomium olivicolor]
MALLFGYCRFQLLALTAIDNGSAGRDVFGLVRVEGWEFTKAAQPNRNMLTAHPQSLTPVPPISPPAQ